MAITRYIPTRANRRTRLIPFPDSGDGSTLSLDFTTGVLDPRLTFSRSSTATFINSQGYVQFDDHNLVVNSTFGSSATPQGWSGSTGVSLTTPSVGVRRAVTTTAAQNWIQSANIATSTGLTYSTSVYINDVSGQHYANTLTITSSPTSVTYYRNGVSVGQFDTAQPGLITMTWTASTGFGHGMRVGIGATGANVASAVCEFTEPRTSRGTNAQPNYFANTSTTSAYYAPRFDYDPTTLTPRGLLIEGSATNRVTDSQNITTGTWTVGGNTTLTANTNEVTDPAGGNTATKIALAANAYCSRAQQVVLSANTTYTFSFWVRGTTGSGPRAFASGGSDLTCTPSTFTYTNTGWTRVQTTFTTGASLTTIFVYVCSKSTSVGSSDVLYVWGAQLEAGSGASSYIPTGSSTGGRAIDICTMSNIAALNYNANGGTLFAHFSNNTENGNFAGSIAFNNGGNYAQRFRWGSGLLLVTYFQPNGTSALGSNLNGSRTSFASAKAATSYSFDGTTTSTALSINGAQATTTPTSSATSGVSIATAFALNSDNSSAGTDYPSIAIRSIKFWPTGLTMEQMNALTVNP